ncbi:MAG: sigma-70 family RNA polymerase sigma factor [Anaerolineae bacterium]|nr:MAG: sigma-70 family RNA polymerase sigma factor [Anaerolineae bacterium]
MIDEQKLIASARGGHLHAFNQLIQAYQGVAYGVARRILSDPDLAADAVQDSFIKAYHKLDQYRGGSFKAWLLRIVVNTCYDRLRTAAPSDDVTGRPVRAARSERASAGADRGPESYALRRELRVELETAIADLPYHQRVVVVLSDIEGYNYHEISDIVGIPLGTVKSRIARGRARLRDRLVVPHYAHPAQPTWLPTTGQGLLV